MVLYIIQMILVFVGVVLVIAGITVIMTVCIGRVGNRREYGSTINQKNRSALASFILCVVALVMIIIGGILCKHLIPS